MKTRFLLLLFVAALFPVLSQSQTFFSFVFDQSLVDACLNEQGLSHEESLSTWTQDEWVEHCLCLLEDEIAFDEDCDAEIRCAELFDLGCDQEETVQSCEDELSSILELYLNQETCPVLIDQDSSGSSGGNGFSFKDLFTPGCSLQPN
ncbi:MAG: hypothetical protein H7A33_05570 [Deltaproteobacteria bacterium]|nr:hypothetical protein [Deltaproteobacteria bacterium]